MIGCAFGWLAAFAMALALIAPARAEEPVRIDVITPETGGGSFLGSEDKIATAIGKKFINDNGGINGRPVSFTLYDDQSNPQVDVQLLNQILGNSPAVILGPHLVAGCSAILPLLRDGPVDYCLSPGIHPESGSYAFTSNVSTYDVERVQLRFLRLKGWTRVALITSTDATGQDGERGIDEALKLPENRMIELVDRAHFNPTDVSVAAQIARMSAAKPQAVFIWTSGTPLGTVLNGLSQAGIALPVAISYGNMTFPQMTQYAAFMPKEAYFAAGEWPPHPPSLKLDPAVETAQTVFRAAFAEAKNSPDAAATAAWDPMMIVASALRTLGPGATARQLRDHIAALSGFAGINGIYDFTKVPQRGLSEDNAVVTRWMPARKTWEIVSRPGGVPLEP